MIAKRWQMHSVNAIAKRINTKQNELRSRNLDNTVPLHCLMQSFKNPFPNINLKFVSSNEIENIIS
jgi:hypothetical protein